MPNSRKPARLRNIQRIDNPENRTHGWLAIVQRYGTIHSKHFSDASLGGKRAALDAAIHFRNATRKALRDPNYPLWRRNRKRRNNTSGIVGVGRYVSYSDNRKKTATRIFWQASWDDAEGRRRSRKFEVSKYGEREAKRLAVEVRAKALRELARRR